MPKRIRVHFYSVMKSVMVRDTVISHDKITLSFLTYLIYKHDVAVTLE